MRFLFLQHAKNAVSVASALALALAAGQNTSAQTPTPKPRLPMATPSPVQTASSRPVSVVDAARARFSALRALTPHVYSFRRPVAQHDPRGDVLYRGPGVQSPAKADCARVGPVIAQITGGENVHALTISGSCFGPAPGGQVLVRAKSGEEPLPVQSWTESSVRVAFYGEKGGNQTLSLRVGVPVASAILDRGGRPVSGMQTYAYSAPAQLAYVAPQVEHDGDGRVSNVSCALNGLCEAGWGMDMTTCSGGMRCKVAWHNALPANVTSPDGVDVWRITLKPGFSLARIELYSENAGLFIDQTPSEGHVDFRVRWKYQHYHDLVPREPGDTKPIYHDYNDGSYMFNVILLGPEGVDP